MSFSLRRTCLLAALSACGGHTLDIGSSDGGLAATAELRQGDASGLTGPLWKGVIEDGQLSNGSSLLEMTLSIDSDGAATGSLLLGDGTLLRPPTDPDVGYPPGVQFPISGPLGFYEGFPYTMLDGRLDGSTLTFHVADLELWTQWCALQKPAFSGRDADGAAYYLCAPNGSFYQGTSCSETPSTASNGEQIPIDCGKAELCLEDSPCDCSATDCRVRNSGAANLSFDLTIKSTSADGTMSGELGDHAVHFVRGQ